MNDLQKKLAIIGLTAFIVWVIMAIDNNAVEKTMSGIAENKRIDTFISAAIYGKNIFGTTIHWLHTVTFTIWTGSLIAFNTYKD